MDLSTHGGFCPLLFLPRKNIFWYIVLDEKNVVFYQKYRGLSEQSFFLIKISPSQGKIWLFFGGGKYSQKSETSNKMQHRRMGPGGETGSRRAASCCSHGGLPLFLHWTFNHQNFHIFLVIQVFWVEIFRFWFFLEEKLIPARLTRTATCEMQFSNTHSPALSQLPFQIPSPPPSFSPSILKGLFRPGHPRSNPPRTRGGAVGLCTPEGWTAAAAAAQRGADVESRDDGRGSFTVACVTQQKWDLAEGSAALTLAGQYPSEGNRVISSGSEGSVQYDWRRHNMALNLWGAFPCCLMSES